jgi:predicted metal-dependent hydrolase
LSEELETSAKRPTGELAEALRLFDAGEYLESHEVLDELWEATSGPDSDFYKGLIQAAIAMHHFQLGNLDGARKLYRGHRRYLAPYLPAHLGVDLELVLAELQRVLTPVLRGEAVFAFDARPQVVRVD